MKRYSIYYSITFISVLSVMGIVLAFLYLIQYDKENYSEELNSKYSVIAGATLFHLNNLITAKEMEEQIKNYKMEEIVEEPLKSYIIENGEVLGTIQDKKLGKSSVISYKNGNYLSIVYRDKTMLLKDPEYQAYRYDVIRAIFAFVIIVVIVAYILTIRKIKPLKRLKRQIDKFASGNLDIPQKQDGTDEISEVANAFYDSVTQIKKMNHSRQLFLRNVMHELKTPITKGRICVEMIEDGKQKQRLITVFERLETMINEFASIEQLTSGIGLTNETKPTRLIDLLDEAIDLAMVERQYIDFYVNQDMILNVDFKLFSLAIKNVLDNGIKYSTDRRVKIITDSNSILFYSTGEKLDKPFEHYLAPFTQGSNSTKSFGLGLYIVDNIIKAHGLKFTYTYQDGKNIFGFENLKNIL
ncbi:MAG: ArsS family sensor histidine kinase [Campylobacteraceae bacterium]